MKCQPSGRRYELQAFEAVRVSYDWWVRGALWPFLTSTHQTLRRRYTASSTADTEFTTDFSIPQIIYRYSAINESRILVRRIFFLASWPVPSSLTGREHAGLQWRHCYASHICQLKYIVEEHGSWLALHVAGNFLHTSPIRKRQDFNLIMNSGYVRFIHHIHVNKTLFPAGVV
jgi:hypothetical protein